MKNENKRWLLKGVTTVLLFGVAIMLNTHRKELVKVEAATNLVLMSESRGWNNTDPERKFIESPADSDIYTITVAATEVDQYKITREGTENRIPAAAYDFYNSNASYLVYLLSHDDESFYVLYPGTITIKVYNPEDSPTSPAGARRFTIDFATMPTTEKSATVLGGLAVDETRNQSNDNNRLLGLASDFNGRYMALTRHFAADEFKVFLWERYESFGYSHVDGAHSNAYNKIEWGDMYVNNINVKTADNYMVVLDIKERKIQFHNSGSTYQIVSKYDGTTLIEKEVVFNGVTEYTPSNNQINGKRFGGWYTDPELTIEYVPGPVPTAMNLYGYYYTNIDTKLSFYDRSKALTAGDDTKDVYVYGWNIDDAETLGEWPGTKMTNHGYSYYSLDVAAANVSQYVIFNTGMGGAQTATFTWEIGKNFYKYAGSSWVDMSAAHHGATLFAIRILHETRFCDATGTTNNVPVDKWNELADEFDGLDAAIKTYLQDAFASYTGDLVGQAVARYDFIVQKYGIATFANFIDRTLPPSGAPLLIVSEKRNIFVASSFGIMAFITIAGIMLLAKKRCDK